jgi:hypothetical protein
LIAFRFYKNRPDAAIVALPIATTLKKAISDAIRLQSGFVSFVGYGDMFLTSHGKLIIQVPIWYQGLRLNPFSIIYSVLLI